MSSNEEENTKRKPNNATKEIHMIFSPVTIIEVPESSSGKSKTIVGALFEPEDIKSIVKLIERNAKDGLKGKDLQLLWRLLQAHTNCKVEKPSATKKRTRAKCKKS